MTRHFDFDTPVDRRGSGSYKWDSASQQDVIPLWVADMDFPTAPVIIDALRRRVDHGVFGYVKVSDDYYDALISWNRHRHGWTINRDMVIYTSGVVPAVSAIIKALTRPGDGVIVNTPAYNCFFSSIRNNRCTIVENPLIRVDSGDSFTYRIDFDSLEEACADPANKVMILCNPHNPTGRIWTRGELEEIAGICHRHGVTVISDEIHCELTLPGREYTPYATVDPDAVICCSPSKAFNIAGLQIANIVAPSEPVRAVIDRAINDNEVCDVNPFGVTALIAAYNHGAPWLDELRDYISGNYAMLLDFFAAELPSLKVCSLESTYLAWVDITALGISSEKLEEHALETERVWVNAGSMYGSEGYIRINMACPRSRLLEGLRRLKRAVANIVR
ncbi:MAG: pyridoxal phosphate-dependent aminotransferase [Muribaculum sp.]|nr:pyridoxal phosphate-dependent aminotransferase [Muribaculum sp.]